jgi:hypothetical protein
MVRIKALPERLRYLRPFQKYLAALPAAEVGESTDSTMLEKILRKRLRGMSSQEATNQLSADLEGLEAILSVGQRRDIRLGFIFGFLFSAATMPENLLKPPARRKKVVERLTMKLPPGAKLSVDEYSLAVKWKRQNLFALRCDMDDEFSRDLTLAEFAHPNASERELFTLMGETALAKLASPNTPQNEPKAIHVKLGAATGHKRVAFGDSPVVWKRAGYLLKIPGGYVSIDIQAGHLFDETEWEYYLATLRFTKPLVM